MRLSDKERLILHAAQLEAKATAKALSKATGFREHTVRYCLSSLRQRGVLEYVPFINVYPLGFTQFGLFFSLASERADSNAELLDFLSRSEYVSFIVQVGGDFQYGISVCTRDIFGLSAFLKLLASRFGNLFFSKAVAARERLTDFSMKYLSPRSKEIRELSWGNSPFQQSFDETDHKILRAANEGEFQSMRELAKRAGLGQSLVEQRFRRLEKDGVIVGHHYVVRTDKLGIQSFYLLIDSKGLRPNLSEDLFKFAREHPNIIFFVECLGSWDFEMGIEVEDPQDAVRLKQALTDKFGDSLNSIKLLFVFRYHKVSKYPFRSYPPPDPAVELGLKNPTPLNRQSPFP
ncbi:MAG: Lrp/AsnC family transcriptional regulator [Bdellovibrionales bacterium]|nr:Lrp/AsnC family transcriptional regulator [Bdellovibrionales bacterium]